MVEVGDKYVSHDENKEYVSNFLILDRPKDRVNYYCENKVYIGECLTTYKTNVKLKFSLPVSINSVTVKDFAYYFFKTFKDSKSHWSILMMENDIDYIGCSLQMDFNGSFISFVVLTGNDKNNKYGDLYVEGLSIK